MSINNKNKARVNLRNPIEIAEGKGTQDDSKYSSSIFGTVDGASKVKHPDNFHRPKDRTPERQIATDRVRAYLANPKATDEFMEFFNNPKFEKE